MTQLFEIEEDGDIGITLSDGTRLSARIWRPRDAGPVPAILEYLPYRKRDGTRERDALTHPWMAARGYACVRVDMRGCGDSDGLFDDEYSEQELRDGVEVVHWLAGQDWCSGAVGMVGISWGGFNGLQIAARAPEPLKAVVSLCSTVDRFADDIHYKGGVMLGENPGWAATALSWFSMPPDPAVVGETWRDTWVHRLENTPFLLERWVRHQTRDAYWQHGSVCEDYAAIRAAVLSVGGWHDGYRNTIGHLLRNLDAPVKGLIGPWNHKYPHIGTPGPRIDFLSEMLRWWDHWLKGIDRGVDADPALRAYVVDSIPPRVHYDQRPGRWVGVDWPDATSETTLSFSDTRLAPSPGPTERKVFTRLACGQMTGEYFPFGFGPGELPDDQTADDGLSTCFDSAPLDASMDLLGRPEVMLEVAADQPRAQLAVRLCDLRPDGTSAMIAHGFLNLRQRNGHDRSEPLDPGKAYSVTVPLDMCGYALPAGHRLRVAVSASYWPFVFPEGLDATLTITAGTLSLPVLDPDRAQPVGFDGPTGAPPLERRVLVEPVEAKRTIRDLTDRSLTQHIIGDDGAVEHVETGLRIARKVDERFTIHPDDPASAVARFQWERALGRGDWHVSSTAVVQVRGQSDAFALEVRLTARDREEEVFDRTWTARIPRA